MQAIIQGIIQGLTEFLPISSSGHLVLAQQIFHLQDLDPAFNVFVQGGTIISLLIYYAPRFKRLNLSSAYLINLAIATTPAVIAGLLLQDYIDALFATTSGLGWGFVLTTIFILLTFIPRTTQSLNKPRALAIGLAQAAAILPSLSRSGATIGAAHFLGIKSQDAFDFSFLMSIPVMLGSTILSIRHIEWSVSMTPSYLLGFFVAAIVGYVTLILLARVMKQGKFYLFAPYTFALAILSFYLA